ncbi:glycosyltransferase [Jejudonia soesokkakensis]|uniref:Glycosyltransferase n=1 Tax=Jejudonia soesokkakensis TaxID=1323432 RepID=A0ABW2MTJ8_9FLAO
MKVLQITTSSKGGAGIAALRLHNALRAYGVASAYLSKDLTIDFHGNHIADEFFAYQKPSIFQKVFRKIEHKFFPSAEQKVQKQLQKLKEDLTYEMLSTPYSSYPLEKHPLVQEATIVNLHMVSGILAYKRFFSIVQKPMVWTLHDMNPFSGLFHYQGDTDQNSNVFSEIEHQIRAYKKQCIQKSSLKAVVGPSQWMTDLAIQSNVFKSETTFKTIANSIDKESIDVSGLHKLKTNLGIADDRLVLLFIAHDVNSPRKGMDVLVDALHRIDALPITLLVVGKGSVVVPKENIKTVSLGVIYDPHKMQELYTLADAFLLPSREDNLPNVMLESFMVGTPVLSFKIGGMATHIQEGITGMLAPDITAERFANTIEDFAKQHSQYDSEVIKAYAKTHFSPKLQAEGYTELYKTILV